MPAYFFWEACEFSLLIDSGPECVIGRWNSRANRICSVIITGVVKVILGYVPGGCVPSYAQTEIWATVHVCIAIVCACLPLLMPLIRRVNDSMVMWKLRGRAVAVERRNHSSERSVLSEGTSRHRRSNYEHFNGGLELMGGTSAPAAASE